MCVKKGGLGDILYINIETLKEYSRHAESIGDKDIVCTVSDAADDLHI